MSGSSLAPPILISQKFWRISKYLFPQNKLAWNLRGSPPPENLATLDDLQARYPHLVTQTEVGFGPDWGGFDFPTLFNGKEKLQHASAVPAYHRRLFSLRETTSVGRRSSIIGPDKTLVAEHGYFAPNTDPRNQQWTDFVNLKSWRARWINDMRFRYHLPAIQRLAGTAVLLNNPACHNFYHWLLEIAPRVMLLRRAGLEADWYVVDCHCGYQKRILELLGIPSDRCIQPHYGLHLQADLFLRPSTPDASEFLAMAEIVSKNVPNATSKPISRRIYISRKTASHRKLTNELELEQFLKSYGFESYSFDQVEFDEQVRIMRSAECIITVHGAALANLIFAKPSTQVIEICPDNRFNPDCFPRLSRKIGHNHIVVMAQSSRYRQNLSVNVQDVRLALDRCGLKMRLKRAESPNGTHLKAA